MKFSLDKQEKYTLIHLQEEKLDTIIAPALKSELVLLNAEGINNIILDLSGVNYVDSSGLSAILVGSRLCKAANGTFVVCKLHPNVAKLIELSQLNDILNIIPSLEEAIDFVFIEEIERELGAE